MTVISFVSCSGAPGATTLSLATAAALTETDVPDTVMVEVATSGGVLSDQYDLPTEPGLTSLALTLDDENPDLLMHAQPLPGGVPVVVAPPSGSRTATLLTAKADMMAQLLKRIPETVIADCGRVAVGTPVLPLLRHSSLVPVVIRPSRHDFHLAALTLAEINETLDQPLPAGWVIVGSCPWSDDEIVNQYGLPIFASIPEDSQGAQAVGGLRKFRRRSPLARTCLSFADDLAKHLRVSDDDAPLSYLDAGQDHSPAHSPAPEQPVEPEQHEPEQHEPEHHEPEQHEGEPVAVVPVLDPEPAASGSVQAEPVVTEDEADVDASSTVAIGGKPEWLAAIADGQLGASAR